MMIMTTENEKTQVLSIKDEKYMPKKHKTALDRQHEEKELKKKKKKMYPLIWEGGKNVSFR